MSRKYIITSFFLFAALGNTQTRVQPADKSDRIAQPNSTENKPAGPSVQPPPDYVLGGNDQVQIDVPSLPDEFSSEKTFRIDGGGDLGVPMIGHVQAGGLTAAQLEESINSLLKRIVKEPDVVVTVVGFGSQPVSVLGAVNTPGIVQIQGRKNLFEVLSLAGGMAENAGYLITVTRDMKWGALPLADAHTDNTGQFSIGSVKIKNLLSSSNTADNILIMPGDKVAVPNSDLVYAVGDVTKPGGFLLNQHESLSALQVVSLAEGFAKTAAPQHAKILRVVKDSPSRQEIAVNLKALVEGKTPDIQLQPEDILFIPNSAAKSTGYGVLNALTIASGSIIYAGAR